MQQMRQQMQQMMSVMAMQTGFQPGGMGAQVQAAWEGEEVDCQNEEDGGWGPCTIPAPAFSAGGPKFKGKGRGKAMQLPGKGAATGQAWAPY